MYYKNLTMMFLIKNLVFHKRTKCIDIKLHFVREVVNKGVVKVKKVPNEDNPTYAHMKVLLATKFSYCLNLVSMLSM